MNKSPAANHSNIFVVCGPGGAGKGTIVQQMITDDPKLFLSRSWTTRSQRPGESDDAYHFVTAEQFTDRAESGGFLEWAEFLNHRYGTPTPNRASDRDLILEIEVQGAQQVRAKDPSVIVIMVLPPSRAEQERRMRERGDPDEIVTKRLTKSDSELAVGYEMADLIVVNNNVADAAREIGALVERIRIQRG